MPAIPNPNPLTLGVANSLWVTRLDLTNSNLVAILNPWDGQYIVANASATRKLILPLTDPATAAVADALRSNLATLSGQSGKLLFASITSNDTSTAMVFANYDTGQTKTINGKTVPVTAPYRIQNLFTVMASNSAIATLFSDVMTFLAGKVV